MKIGTHASHRRAISSNAERIPTAQEAFRDPMAIDQFLGVAAKAESFDQYLEFRDAYYQSVGSPGTKILESQSPQAEVAVLDSFAVMNETFGHGEQVSWIIEKETGLAADQILPVPNEPLAPLPLLTVAGDVSAEQRLVTFIEANQADSLDFSTLKLRELLKHDSSNVKVVNQSQGITQLSVFKELTDAMTETVQVGETTETKLTAEGRVILDGLGLSGELTPELRAKSFAHLVDLIYTVHEESDVIAQAKSRHENVSKDLAERGINYVVAVGNDGTLMNFLKSGGLPVPESADDNLLINQHNVAVAALDNNGTPDDYSDDRFADFNSRTEQTAFLASGVAVPVGEQTATGSSFASPKVAAELFTIADLMPGISTEDSQAWLRNVSLPSVAGSDIHTLR